MSSFLCEPHTTPQEVLVFYDWVINLPREAKTFWRGDARVLSSSLYFATRWISLAMVAMVAMGLAPWSDKVCVLPFRYKRLRLMTAFPDTASCS